jgi:TetR/AcrR family transcriptional regulator, copper-responsive repressor
MVHKEPKKPRGRPKAYDPDQALQGAMQAFWALGFSGTSVDVLSDATDMNRPSMYAAFGDKRALYLKTLERYTQAAEASILKALAPDRSYADGLRALFDQALRTYSSGDAGAQGCYLIGTAATEAASDAEIRAVLLESLRSFEALIAARIEQAKKSGEVPRSADADALAMTATAFLHSLAVRSRAGETRTRLKSLIETAIASVCG